MISVNIFYIYLSKKTWRGVATENSYQKGIAYNQALSEAKKQQETGWKITSSLVNKGNKTAILSLTLKDENQKIIDDATILVKCKRPTQEGFDFEVVIEAQKGSKNSVYSSKITFPIQGQWDLEFIAKKEGRYLQEVKRYMISK